MAELAHVPAAASLTLADLLREHPWPAAHAGARRLEWMWTIDVALTPDELWPLISDMSRLNRALGNPEMTFEERAGEGWGTGRYGGVFHEWREVPWDWVAGRWFSFLREYRRGAMTALWVVNRIEPTAAGSRLYVYFGAVPRWRVLVPAMRLNFAAIGRACPARSSPYMGAASHRVTTLTLLAVGSSVGRARRHDRTAKEGRGGQRVRAMPSIPL